MTHDDIPFLFFFSLYIKEKSTLYKLVFVLQKVKSFNVSRDPGDGWRRSDSGETREGTKASKTILGKDALLPYQKEK